MSIPGDPYPPAQPRYRGTLVAANPAFGDPLPPLPTPAPLTREAARKARLLAIEASIPTFRYAAREAGVPGWVAGLLALMGKWLPVLLSIAVQLIPLFLNDFTRDSRASYDPAEDDRLDPPVRSAIRAYRAGTLGNKEG